MFSKLNICHVVVGMLTRNKSICYYDNSNFFKTEMPVLCQFSSSFPLTSPVSNEQTPVDVFHDHPKNNLSAVLLNSTPDTINPQS